MIALPEGFGVALDRSIRVSADGRTLVGGAPLHRLRLTRTGAEVFRSLRDGDTESSGARLLARRLIDAGLAHPRPPVTSPSLSVTTVVPVRDRPEMLDRCLAGLGGAGGHTIVVDDGSRDGATVGRICERRGASLIRLDPGRGAGAARNAGIAAAETDLIAFIDSDCIPDIDWVAALAPQFADPLVGAVAPRIVPVVPLGASRTLTRFDAVRSPLDLGPHESLVGPCHRVPYVPSAALLVRRRALGDGFDPALIYGEDVDLVWRIRDAGWRIRYVPDIRVRHEEPASWGSLLQRRFRYGKSAAPLALRHRGRLTHVVVSPATAAAALLLARKPCAAAALLIAPSVWGRGRGTSKSHRVLARGAQAAAGLGRAATTFVAPALVAGLANPRSRLACTVLLAVGPADEWLRLRPQMDLLRWTIACAVDDMAYGLGVWRGCLAHRTLAPVAITSERKRMKAICP